MPTTADDNTTLYLTEQGARLSCRENRFAVTKGTETLCELPIESLRRVVICGNIQVTTQAMRALMQRGVDTAFLSTRGQLYGRLESPDGGSPELRRAQYRAAQDPAVRLAVSREIVRAKLHNQRVLLARRQGRSADIQRACAALAGLEERAAQCGSLDSLRGIEGSGAGHFFRGFAAALKFPMGFRKRQRRPPPDPVNATLSLGYTLLHKDLIAAIQIVGLDPAVGFFHDRRPGHPALASDLTEEFRAPIADSLALDLINHSELRESDFELLSGEGCRFKQEGLKRFLRAYAERLHSPITHPCTGERTTYLRCLGLAARSLAHVLTGQRPRYQPFLMH